MKNHLSDDVASPMTVVNPPPLQEMNAADENKESAQSAQSATASGNDERAVVPV